MPVYGQCEDRDPVAVVSPSLIELRDAIVHCFVATHGPHFGQTRTALGLEAHHGAVCESVVDMVRLAFQQYGGSYDNPTPELLTRVVTFLAERSLSWGASEDDVFQHHCSMTRAIGRMRLRSIN